MYDGPTILREAMDRYNINFFPLVAAISFWAHPEAYKLLLEDNGERGFRQNGAFYPHVRRARTNHGEERRQWVRNRTILLDDNTYANKAIKKMIGVSGNIKHFETCHIWPDSAYNEGTHTAIANLVLLPEDLASLTDHNEEMQDVLKYRSYELYNWRPKNKSIPKKPKSYPSNWKEPFAFTVTVEGAIRNRRF
jgi:hypothetical protein